MPTTTELIKELRDKTGAGIMECKKAVEDAVRLSKEKYCSVSAMLQKTAKISFEIQYAVDAAA